MVPPCPSMIDLADFEAEPRPLLSLSRKKWLPNLLGDFRTHATTVIGNGDLDRDHPDEPAKVEFDRLPCP